MTTLAVGQRIGYPIDAAREDNRLPIASSGVVFGCPQQHKSHVFTGAEIVVGVVLPDFVDVMLHRAGRRGDVKVDARLVRIAFFQRQRSFQLGRRTLTFGFGHRDALPVESAVVAGIRLVGVLVAGVLLFGTRAVLVGGFIEGVRVGDIHTVRLTSGIERTSQRQMLDRQILFSFVVYIGGITNFACLQLVLVIVVAVGGCTIECDTIGMVGFTFTVDCFKGNGVGLRFFDKGRTICGIHRRFRKGVAVAALCGIGGVVFGEGNGCAA